MNNVQLIPDRFKFLSGSALKVIAVVTMLIDHIASHLIAPDTVLFSVAGVAVMPYPIMRFIGRMAFPLFVFLLTEGFVHTRSRLRYGLSLLICAVISEVPWDLVHGGVLFYRGQNVFFTLTLGYAVLCALDRLRGKPLLQLAVLFAGLAVAVVLQADFGTKGYVFILLMFALRGNELLRPLIAFLLNNHWGVLPAFVPISLYNGRRGFIKGAVLKYAFYSFYPVHLFIIYLIKYHIV